jgi:hypothetical protein
MSVTGHRNPCEASLGHPFVKGRMSTELHVTQRLPYQHALLTAGSEPAGTTRLLFLSSFLDVLDSTGPSFR